MILQLFDSVTFMFRRHILCCNTWWRYPLGQVSQHRRRRIQIISFHHQLGLYCATNAFWYTINHLNNKLTVSHQCKSILTNYLELSTSTANKTCTSITIMRPLMQFKLQLNTFPVYYQSVDYSRRWPAC